MLSVFCPLSAQQKTKLHKRTVLKKTEKWEPGKVISTSHLLDSFFYDNGQVREVAESKVKSESFKIVDSVPVNNRLVWDNDGKLILVETFKNGRIDNVKSQYPTNRNIIANGGFEQHTNVAKHIITSYKSVDLPKINRRIEYSTIIHKEINGLDTIVHVLHTDTLVYIRTSDKRDMLIYENNYVLLKSNAKTIDSININSPRVVIASGFSTDALMHNCKYNEEKVTDAKGWASIGHDGVKLYDFANKAPEHPLQGVAHYIFSFKPISGNAFAEISTNYSQGYQCKISDPQPLLQAQLNTTLLQGKSYTLEFWLWKPQTYKNGHQLKVGFSQEPVTLLNYQALASTTFHVVEFNNANKGAWQKVSLTFMPTEHARYMTVGFYDHKLDFRKTRTTANGDDYKASWCYVDGFVLGETSHISAINGKLETDESSLRKDFTINEPTNTDSGFIFDGKKLRLNDTLTFENVNFKTNDYSLSDTTSEQLKKLAIFMTKYSSILLSIEGHTDNEGSEAYNLQLSNKRALAIANFISAQGIARERIVSVGFGNTKPIATNETVAGRRQNRRVEFVFKQIQQNN